MLYWSANKMDQFNGKWRTRIFEEDISGKWISQKIRQTKPKAKDRELKKIPTAERKSVYLKLPYKGEVVSNKLFNRIARAVEQTYPAAKLTMVFTSNPILTPCLKDKLSRSTTSFVVYLFNCVAGCPAAYIGRTTRRSSERIHEHHPAWLNHGITKTIRNSIVAHLVDSNHVVDRDQAFKVIYRVPQMRSKGLRIKLLNTAEAVAIRLHKPSLCVQTEFDQTLLLPWPAS